ncbi:MAG: hypothetical protein ACK4S8_15380, partial [Alishewanella aestuarii]
MSGKIADLQAEISPNHRVQFSRATSVDVSIYTEGEDYVARTTSAEERKKQSHLRQQSKVDPPSPLFNKEEGRWKDNRVFELKFATVFAFLFLSIVFVLLFAGVKVPLIAVWISVLFFGLCGQV